MSARTIINQRVNGFPLLCALLLFFAAVAAAAAAAAAGWVRMLGADDRANGARTAQRYIIYKNDIQHNTHVHTYISRTIAHGAIFRVISF